MMNRSVAFVLTSVAVVATRLLAAPANFAGEYADKKFLNGQSVFQLSLEQTGNNVSVFFSAAHNDGHGATPEADGTGKVTPKGAVEFKWQDSLKNAGMGTISRSGNDVILSLKATRVADPRCLEFYRGNIRLAPAGKK